jgi:hypothetical protein
VRGSTDGLHTSILAAVISARRNDMTVEAAADLLAILQDCGLGSDLHTSIFDHFDPVDDLNFLKCHFDLQSKSYSGQMGQHN